MRKLTAFAFTGVAAAALAGTAIAAAPKSHVMNVPLPDGSIVRVEYVGDVAPKVTVAPSRMTNAGMPEAMPFPSFAGFDKIFQEMNQRTEEMMRRAQQVAHQPAAAAPYIASYGNVPGETSTTIVSVSNGGASCTRTTETVSQGPGKPPKVTTSVSGQCGGAAGASEPTHRT